MDWHSRFQTQAGWTSALRRYFFQRAASSGAQRVLEVGCGTGAVLQSVGSDLPAGVHPQIHGLDLAADHLRECQHHAPAALVTRGNALALPYASQQFDIVFCHYLLLWIPDPDRALSEMKRVARPGGYVAALAEPDYTARLDEPAELRGLGQLQNRSLEHQGAALDRGRQLADLFRKAGIRIVETGTLAYQAQESLREVDWQSEWDVLESDIAPVVPKGELQRLRKLDRAAFTRGQRLLRVPTYFAWGQV